MALTQTQVSQLYVAIFGRSSEGEGNKYWQTAVDGVSATAAAMLETPAAKEYFKGKLDTNEEFISAIYLNTLGKKATEDPDGIAYWVGLLNDGKSKGEVVAAIIEAIDSYAPGGENYDPTDIATVNAYNQFTNRVDVSNYVATNIENVPSNGDLNVFKAYNDNTTYDNTTKDAQFEKVDNDVATGMLTESLSTLAAANKALSDFLKEAPALNNKEVADTDGDGTPSGGTVETEAGKPTKDGQNADATFDEKGSITKYYNELATTLEQGGYTGLASFGKKSASLQDAAIAEKKADLEKVVSKAKDAAASGMTSLLAAVEAASEVVTEKSNAVFAANTVLAGKSAEAEAVLKETYTAVNETSGVITLTTVGAGSKLTDNDKLTKLDANGKVVLADFIKDAGYTAADTTKKAEFEAAQAKLADFITAYNAKVAAKSALETAKEALDTAAQAVVLAENKAYSILDAGTKLVDYSSVDGSAKDQKATVDLSANDVIVFDTKAKSDGAKLSITKTFSAAVATTEIISIKINGKIYSATYKDDAATTYGLLKTAIDADGVVVVGISGDALTFSSKAAGDKFTINTELANSNGTTKVTSSQWTADTDTDITTAAAPKAEALKDAITKLETFKELVAAFEEARELNAQEDALQKAITDATLAITNATDADVPGLGLNLISIDTDGGNKNGTAKDDIFLLALPEDKDATATIYSFSSKDAIYVGTKFNLVVADKSIEKGNFGDVSALDAIVYDNGTDTLIYFEEKTFAGNGSGASDVMTITLSGVTGQEVSINADGFLTIA